MPKLLIHSWLTVIPPKPNTIGEFSFSAACATAYAAKLNGMKKSKINIEFSLGILSIEIDSKNTIYMKGPVSEIKEITVKI